LRGVQVYLEGSRQGALSDSIGHFSFRTTSRKRETLVVSFIGYSEVRQVLDFGKRVSGEAVPRRDPARDLGDPGGEYDVTVTGEGYRPWIRRRQRHRCGTDGDFTAWLMPAGETIR